MSTLDRICRILNPSPVYYVPSLNLLRSGNDGQPGQRPLRTRVGTRPPVPAPGLVDGGLFFFMSIVQISMLFSLLIQILRRLRRRMSC